MEHMDKADFFKTKHQQNEGRDEGTTTKETTELKQNIVKTVEMSEEEKKVFAELIREREQAIKIIDEEFISLPKPEDKDYSQNPEERIQIVETLLGKVENVKFSDIYEEYLGNDYDKESEEFKNYTNIKDTRDGLSAKLREMIKKEKRQPEEAIETSPQEESKKPNLSEENQKNIREDITTHGFPSAVAETIMSKLKELESTDSDQVEVEDNRSNEIPWAEVRKRAKESSSKLQAQQEIDLANIREKIQNTLADPNADISAPELKELEKRHEKMTLGKIVNHADSAAGDFRAERQKVMFKKRPEDQAMTTQEIIDASKLFDPELKSILAVLGTIRIRHEMERGAASPDQRKANSSLTVAHTKETKKVLGTEIKETDKKEKDKEDNQVPKSYIRAKKVDLQILHDMIEDNAQTNDVIKVQRAQKVFEMAGLGDKQNVVLSTEILSKDSFALTIESTDSQSGEVENKKITVDLHGVKDLDKAVTKEDSWWNKEFKKYPVALKIESIPNSKNIPEKKVEPANTATQPEIQKIEEKKPEEDKKTQEETEHDETNNSEVQEALENTYNNISNRFKIDKAEFAAIVATLILEKAKNRQGKTLNPEMLRNELSQEENQERSATALLLEKIDPKTLDTSKLKELTEGLKDIKVKDALVISTALIDVYKKVKKKNLKPEDLEKLIEALPQKDSK